MLNNTAARILEEASNSLWLSLSKLDRIMRLWTDGNGPYDDEEGEAVAADMVAMDTSPNQEEVEESYGEEEEE